MELRFKKAKGSIAIFELSAIISGIIVLTFISSSFYDATKIKTQAAEAYYYSETLAENIAEYYEDNLNYPDDDYNNYGVNPGDYVASVIYKNKTDSQYAYVLATFKDGDGTHSVLSNKYILFRIIGSGGTDETPNHLVSNCYTDINTAILTGDVQNVDEVSQIVGNQCVIISNITDVLDITS